MPPQTPYTADLGDREPIASMREGTSRITALVGAWSTHDFERSYAPGKWSARQILTHIAQTELALGNSARFMALAASSVSSAARPLKPDSRAIQAS